MLNRSVTKIAVAGIAALAFFQADCSQRRELSAPEAAQMAATLANDQCDRLYQERPFSAVQHPAVLQNGIYKWGGLDVDAPDGFSALVIFRADGDKPQVEIFFVHDPPSQLQRPPGYEVVPFQPHMSNTN